MDFLFIPKTKEFMLRDFQPDEEQFKEMCRRHGSWGQAYQDADCSYSSVLTAIATGCARDTVEEIFRERTFLAVPTKVAQNIELEDIFQHNAYANQGEFISGKVMLANQRLLNFIEDLIIMRYPHEAEHDIDLLQYAAERRNLYIDTLPLLETKRSRLLAY